MEIIQQYFGEAFYVIGTIIVAVLSANKERVIRYLKRAFESHTSLSSHDLFTIINDKQINSLKYIKFENSPVKTKMIRDFLHIKLSVIEDRTLEFVKDRKKTKLRDEDLYKACVDLFLGIVEEHDRLWLEHFTKKGVDEETIEYIVTTFNKWHRDTVESIQARMNSVFRSGFYKTSYQKIVAMLEVFAFSIDLVCKEGVKSFEEMNGKLESVEYN